MLWFLFRSDRCWKMDIYKNFYFCSIILLWNSYYIPLKLQFAQAFRFLHHLPIELHDFHWAVHLYHKCLCGMHLVTLLLIYPKVREKPSQSDCKTDHCVLVIRLLCKLQFCCYALFSPLSSCIWSSLRQTNV